MPHGNRLLQRCPARDGQEIVHFADRIVRAAGATIVPIRHP